MVKNGVCGAKNYVDCAKYRGRYKRYNVGWC